MKVRRLCLLLSLLLCGCHASGQPPLEFPSPPQQQTPWRADTTIPTNLVSAAQTLFEQGFPNSQGCEYREIEVKVSSVWGDKSSLAKTRGWVLPAKAGSTNRFAICWNGLIYPTVSVSAPADLHAEITNTGTVGYPRFNSAPGEVRTVFFSNAVSPRILLLLREGEIDTAVKSRIPDSRLQFTAHIPDDPYLEFAGDWAWAMFDRLISAHMRGDESLALATARQLAQLQPKIEAECDKRGFKRQPYYDSRHEHELKPYLDFLEQFPALLADLERREKEGKHTSSLEDASTKNKSQSARISALIHDLDLVQAKQWGQPGGVDLAEDPIVSALIQEGDAAVEPLLTCLETDTRMTRSVGFGRDFMRNRTVLSVKSATRTALQSILQAGFQTAPEIRAYWNKYKGMNLNERCFAILKDDDASARWQEAAAHITQPENQTTFPGGFSTTSPAPTNTPVRLRGEPLRAKANPSVADVMARRATEVPANNPNAYDLATGCEIGLRLAEWDLSAAAPVAKVLAGRCRTVLAYSEPRNPSSNNQLGRLLTKLTLVRARSGQSNAFDDYTAWIITTTPAQLEYSVLECLEPFKRFPTNAVLDATAEKLFAENNSAWGKLPWKSPGFQSPLGTELDQVPAFRKMLARELEDKTPCGSISWRAPNWISLELTNSVRTSSGSTVDFPQTEQPATGTKTDLRWCDSIAWSLSSSKHIPFFNPFAPVETRNQAIQNARKLLLEK